MATRLNGGPVGPPGKPAATVAKTRGEEMRGNRDVPGRGDPHGVYLRSRAGKPRFAPFLADRRRGGIPRATDNTQRTSFVPATCSQNRGPCRWAPMLAKRTGDAQW